MEAVADIRKDTEAILNSITELLRKIEILDTVDFSEKNDIIGTDLVNTHVSLLLVSAFSGQIKKKIEQKIVENTPEEIDH